MRSFAKLLRRFRDDERGVFAVFFALFAVVLIAAAGAVVDFTTIELARTKAQQALDAAALGLAPKIYTAGVTAETVKTQAQNLVTERVGDSSITINVTGANIDKPNGTLTLSGSITVPMAFVQLVGIPSITARLVAQATKGSVNLEVAVALDNTGSMSGDIEFLREGLNGVIDIIVSDNQEPTYSKMALAPYAEGVYAGDYADKIRGPIPAAVPITTMNWAETPVDITAATVANPVVITTATNHGYINGDIVFINGVKGMTTLNSKFYMVAGKTNTTFQLRNTDNTTVDGAKYNKYTANTSTVVNTGDFVRRCTTWINSSSACQVYVDSTAHGFVTGDYIRTDASTTTTSTFRNKFYTVTKVNNNRYSLDSTTSVATTWPLSGVGGAWCTKIGCEWYRFSNKAGTSTSTWRISKCVTERATKTYTDDAPSVTWMGRNYTNTSGTCDLAQTITPLTSDKDKLHDEADDMTVHGSTAGHLGTAWAWYLLSPEFGSIWNDVDAVPAEYGAPITLKVAILMTDGDYNVQFCNGLDDTVTNCSSVDTSTNQARALCTAMKAKGVVVYTVGFRIKAKSTQAKTMSDCATDTDKAFLPANGQALIDDFREIAQNITDLRLSK